MRTWSTRASTTRWMQPGRTAASRWATLDSPPSTPSTSARRLRPLMSSGPAASSLADSRTARAPALSDPLPPPWERLGDAAVSAASSDATSDGHAACAAAVDAAGISASGGPSGAAGCSGAVGAPPALGNRCSTADMSDLGLGVCSSMELADGSKTAAACRSWSVVECAIGSGSVGKLAPESARQADSSSAVSIAAVAALLPDAIAGAMTDPSATCAHFYNPSSPSILSYFEQNCCKTPHARCSHESSKLTHRLLDSAMTQDICASYR